MFPFTAFAVEPEAPAFVAPAPGSDVTAPEPAPSAEPAASPEPASEPAAPFAFGDFTWMNGQSHQTSFPLRPFGDTLVPSVYLDTNYAYSTNHPRDDTLTGGASLGRHNEFGINLASVGVDWNHKNVVGRLSLQFGNALNLVQDLDGSVARGRGLTTANLRYIREATAGYHFRVGHGLNVEAGIFMSFIGLESYLVAENWSYTRSVQSDHTPFYFQGVRAQYFPTAKIKIEPWLMNGWQSYGKYNLAPSAGLAVRYSPSANLSLLANFYTGTDTRGVSGRVRFHNDHSVLVRLFDRPASGGLSKLAVSLNNHVGFETGGRDASGAALPGPAAAHVVASSLAVRAWFARDTLAFTVRPEVFSNPTAYLAQFPPPGLPAGPGTRALQIWGLTGTVDVMPTDFFALRFESVYRRSSLPYFAGPGGTTSPDGFQPATTASTIYVPDAVKDQLLFVVAANFRL